MNGRNLKLNLLPLLSIHARERERGGIALAGRAEARWSSDRWRGLGHWERRMPVRRHSVLGLVVCDLEVSSANGCNPSLYGTINADYNSEPRACKASPQYSLLGYESTTSCDCASKRSIRRSELHFTPNTSSPLNHAFITKLFVHDASSEAGRHPLLLRHTTSSLRRRTPVRSLRDL